MNYLRVLWGAFALAASAVLGLTLLAGISAQAQTTNQGTPSGQTVQATQPSTYTSGGAWGNMMGWVPPTTTTAPTTGYGYGGYDGWGWGCGWWNFPPTRLTRGGCR